MASIHHPELAVDHDVPDDTVNMWCEIGWRPGTLLEPLPWEPQPRDENGELIPVPDEAPPTDAAPDPDASTDLGVDAEPTTPRKKG